MSKTVKRPMYEELADTPYITRNRELNTTSYDNLQSALDDVNKFSYIDYDSYSPILDAYSNYKYDQLNRSYQNAVNQNVQKQQQRLGTTGSSSGLYTTDTAQQYYNNLASAVAADTAQQANNLMSNELNRRYSNAGLYNNLFNQSGNITQQNDIANWQIRNQNLDRQWANDVEENQNTGWNKVANISKGVLEGFSEGMKTGNIWGGIAGAAVGGIGNSGSTQSSNNLGSNSNINYSSLGNALQSGYDKIANWWNQKSWNKNTTGSWNNPVGDFNTSSYTGFKTA